MVLLFLFLSLPLVHGNNFYYNENSCNDLRPRRKSSTAGEEPVFGSNANRPPYNTGAFVPGQNQANNQPGFQGQPGEAILTTGPSPFYIKSSNLQYKKNRIIKVELLGSQPFDAFLIQARAMFSLNSGQSGMGGAAPGSGPLGKWISVPKGASSLNCQRIPSSAAVDDNKMQQLKNMTFKWQYSEGNIGDIVFVASVLIGDRYWLVMSDRLRWNPFPSDLSGCGTNKSCFRLCPYWQSNCPLSAAIIVAMFETSSQYGGDVVAITLKGDTSQNQNFVAVGFGKDPVRLNKLDINACFRDNGQIMLANYFQESPTSTPFLQSGVIVPEITDADGSELWCRFRRPIRGTGSNLISLNQPLYQFYFRGLQNSTGIYLPRRNSIYTTSSPRNLTVFFNDIIYGNSPKATSSLYLTILFSVASVFMKNS